MKKTVTLILFFTASFAFAQDVIFEDGFEDGTGTEFADGWQSLSSGDITEAPEEVSFPNFYDQWFRNNEENFGDVYTHTGVGSAAVGGTGVNPDPTWSWLVSENITLPSVELLELKYWLWYKSSTPEYFTDFRILLQEEGSDVWEEVERVYVDDTSVEWVYEEEMVVDISAFRNKTIKMAFVHNSTYQMAIDDISIVSNGVLATDDALLNNQITVYPNPSGDLLHINTPEHLAVLNSTLFDVQGRAVLTTNAIKNINIASLSTGLYTLKLKTTSGTVTKKIVKK